ncbi:MAG: cation diffusion facilitator family transporter [Bacteroidales bacterium]|nr:cation diffusion facilitator family transporter [Bacteroidales bacterium]
MHQQSKQANEGKDLFISVWLNMAISLFQIVGGILSNSLALLSDALHNLGDGIALLIAWLANKVSQKPSSLNKTFGYKRIEILAALFNGIALIAISIFLFSEAWQRFNNPETINSTLMLVVAAIGLIANIISVLILEKHKKDNINIKAAYLHLLGDTLSSVAVIIGGVLIYFYELYWIDPLVTVIIGLYIIKESISIIIETVDILMQSKPKDIDLAEIKNKLTKIEGIKNIHHVHIWRLSDKEIHFESHVDLSQDFKTTEASVIREKAEAILYEQFHIDHVTMQMEFNSTHIPDLLAGSKDKNH